MYKIIGADQKEYGPVSADQIRLWIAEGRVNGQTRVQAGGATEWKSVAEVPELAAALPKAPAPTPFPPPSAGQPGVGGGNVASVVVNMPPQSPRTSQMAVWAMVTGILSLLCCCIWWLAGPIAIVLGVVALSNLKGHPELTGRGFAIIGIVLGILALLIWGAWIVFCMFNPDYVQNLQKMLQQ